MEESGSVMLLHSALIGLVLYIIMHFAFGQSSRVAEDRSILIAAFVLIYMLLFGHGLPTNGIVNKNIF